MRLRIILFNAMAIIMSKMHMCFTFSLPAFYRGVLVYIPFAASGLILTMLVVMLLLEWRERKYRSLPEQALTPSVQHGHIQVHGGTEGVLCLTLKTVLLLAWVSLASSDNWYSCLIQRHILLISFEHNHTPRCS